VFVTGVVYDDVDGNGFYDIGEGIAGARVETDVSDFFTISSTSGGYAVPLDPDSGQVVVTLTGQAGTASEAMGVINDVVQVGSENVKVDFGPPDDPPATVFQHTPGGALSLPDGFDGFQAIEVGVLDAASATVCDVDLQVSLAHADRSELLLILESPAGTQVRLFDGASSGVDLRGTFDATLHPREALTAFVGEAYQGTWKLHIRENAGGVSGGDLESLSLSIRPEWVRPLHAPESGMAISSLKLKDSATPRGDKLILKGEVNASGVLLDHDQGGTLRLIDPRTGNELLAVSLDVPVTAKSAVDADAGLKARLRLNKKGTSRGTIVLKLTNVDLPSPLPPEVEVEIAYGGAILSETVPLTSGKFVASKTPPLSPLLFIDSLKSGRLVKGSRTTVVKGRFAAGGALGAVDGAVEVRVGDAHFKLRSDDLQSKGSKLVFKSGSGLRKLVVNTVKHTFQARFTSGAELVEADRIAVELRLGASFFGRTTIRPRDAAGKTIY